LWGCMSEKFHLIFHKSAWIIFIVSLLINIFNWVYIYRADLFTTVLPFDLESSKPINFTDSTYFQVLHNKLIVSIDTLKFESEINYFPNRKNWLADLSGLTRQNDITFYSEKDLEQQLKLTLKARKQVDVLYYDPLSDQTDELNVQTSRKIDKVRLLSLAFNFLFVLIIYFNVLLLLKYSISKDNILMIFFLLILALPGDLPLGNVFRCCIYAGAALLGILFYHFILTKIDSKNSVKALYLISFALAFFASLLFLLIRIDLEMLLYIWSLFWILVGYICLWKKYKKSGSIEQKRLLGAFKGVFLVIISLVLIIILATSIAFLSQGYVRFGIYNIQIIIMAIFLILSAVTFIVGILWFFGSFTWGLLTGTVLDVKIRSTLIYTLIGIFFVTVFGLVDYSLGEFLQKVFGNFIGSEFIAGIPATIGLLIFFNPIRNKVENMVDSRLNTSELDFLEKTDSFSEKLVGESVIEGFEEYICENLIHRLTIKKVALISFDKELDYFKFNEIRGSDIEENSRVEDIHDYLKQAKITRNFIPNENPQEIASFSLILPILYDDKDKWFLALGKKKDGSVYTRNDENALLKLTSRIKLSLKFILAYDIIVNRKYVKTIEQKDKEIDRYKKALAERERKPENQ